MIEKFHGVVSLMFFFENMKLGLHENQRELGLYEIMFHLDAKLQLILSNGIIAQGHYL